MEEQSAYDGPGRVVVVVTDESRALVPRATVLVHYTTESGFFAEETNAAGVAIFNSMRLLRYRVAVRAAGFDPREVFISLNRQHLDYGLIVALTVSAAAQEQLVALTPNAAPAFQSASQPSTLKNLAVGMRLAYEIYPGSHAWTTGVVVGLSRETEPGYSTPAYVTDESKPPSQIGLLATSKWHELTCLEPQPSEVALPDLSERLDLCVSMVESGRGSYRTWAANEWNNRFQAEIDKRLNQNDMTIALNIFESLGVNLCETHAKLRTLRARIAELEADAIVLGANVIHAHSTISRKESGK